MQKTTLIGRLGKDPEMNYSPSGQAVTKFSVAVSRKYKTASGERQEETTWFNVVAWARLAETCNEYLRKGSRVYLEGRIATREYTDKEGVKRYAWELVASEMEMLDTKAESEGRGNGGGSRGASRGGDAMGGDAMGADDIPF